MIWHLKPKLFVLLLGLALLLLMVAADGRAAESEVAGAAPYSCRFGTAALRTEHKPWLDTLNVGAYLNFGPWEQSTNDREFVHMVRVHQRVDGAGNPISGYVMEQPSSLSGLRTLVAQRPGALWLVGNEPDTRHQDGLLPDSYAQAYYELYRTIKSVDPTAQVGNAGLVSATEHRMTYLTNVWNAYKQRYSAPMPVDVWNMHLYILPEVGSNGQPTEQNQGAIGTDTSNAKWESNFRPADCQNPFDQRYCYAEHDSVEIFKKQINNMRQWMANRGQRNKPLILTEWSILYPYDVDGGGCFLQDELGNCFTPDRVTRYLNNTVDYMETATSSTLGYAHDNNKLVQQWFWFATYTAAEGRASNLLVEDVGSFAPGAQAALTQVGRAYQTQAAAQARGVNLLPVAASGRGVGGSNSVRARVEFVNNGNTELDGLITVSFYANSSLTTLIGSTTVDSARGCAREKYVAEVSWLPTSAGRKRFWVKVDSNNQYAEQNEGDNVISGVVIVNPELRFIPLLNDQ